MSSNNMVTCPPLNQSLQEKWNHYDWLTLINVSKASEGRKEPGVKDGKKQVSREWARAGFSAPGLVAKSPLWTLLLPASL